MSAPSRAAADQETAPGAPPRDPLDVQNLSIRYGDDAPAVSGVDLRVGPGQIVGVIGESGCGKSSVALAVLGLLPPAATVTADRMDVVGHDVLDADERTLNAIRGKDAAMVFQEPMTALNPVMRVGAQIAEVLLIHRLADRATARARAVELLELVQVPEPELRVKQFPHQLSGGMRQRVVIAMAMAADPRLLVADEPTTALDVTVQAQILDIIHGLRRRTGMGVLFISHDLGVIARTCDRVVVMYAGQVVEEGVPADVLRAPRHPYTSALLASIPRAAVPPREELPAIAGTLSAEDRARAGCRFLTRCPFALEGCAQPQPLLSEAGSAVRCWRSADLHDALSRETGVPA